MMPIAILANVYDIRIIAMPSGMAACRSETNTPASGRRTAAACWSTGRRVDAIDW